MSTLKQDLGRMFPQIADRLQTRNGHLELLDNGVPVALLLTTDEWESVELTFEVMSDSETMAEIREGEEAYLAGDVMEDEEEVRKLIARRFPSRPFPA